MQYQSIRRVSRVRIAIDSKKSQIFQCVTASAHGHWPGPQKPTDIRIERPADPCPSVLPFQWQKVCVYKLFSHATSKIKIDVHIQSHEHWRLQYACTSATQRLPWLGRWSSNFLSYCLLKFSKLYTSTQRRFPSQDVSGRPGPAWTWISSGLQV